MSADAYTGYHFLKCILCLSVLDSDRYLLPRIVLFSSVELLRGLKLLTNISIWQALNFSFITSSKKNKGNSSFNVTAILKQLM